MKKLDQKQLQVMQQANIMVIDEYLLVAESITELLKAHLKPRLIKYFGSADDAKKELRKRRYDYVFASITMSGKMGPRFIGELCLQFPEVFVIVLCSECSYTTANNLFALGINGILSKCDGMPELKLAMAKIAQREEYISSGITILPENKAEKKGMPKISKMEVEVMRHVADGKSIVETAMLLQLSHHTVVSHRRNIVVKLNLRSAAEMACYVYRHQLS